MKKIPTLDFFLFNSFTCRKSHTHTFTRKRWSVRVHLCVCVCVCAVPLQKQVMAAQKWHGATDDGHYPINLLFLYTLCPLCVLFERTAGVCVCACVCERERDMDEGRESFHTHIFMHTHTDRHTLCTCHKQPVRGEEKKVQPWGRTEGKGVFVWADLGFIRP